MAARPQTDQPRRSVWSDERLDDLATSMRDGFTRIDARLDHFENRVDHRLSQVDDRFSQMDGRFDHLGTRMDSHQRTLVIGLFGLTGPLVAAIVAALTAVLTLS
ncbi:MAG: hypothetical protein M9938_02045 [Solirubrobacterales bacterium]|nr:hypothetical protein [Solirubrobacterales bacterium]